MSGYAVGKYLDCSFQAVCRHPEVKREDESVGEDGVGLRSYYAENLLMISNLCLFISLRHAFCLTL